MSTTPPQGDPGTGDGPAEGTNVPGRRRILWGDLLFSLGVVALGAYFTVGAFAIRLLPSYSRIGPRFFPLLVAAGLLLCGVLLTILALRGRAAPLDQAEDVDVTAATDWPSVLIVAAALLADILLIERLGFVLASAVLFWGVAYGFGSRHYVRDAAVGLSLSLAVYLAFTRLLDLSLPSGVLPLLTLAAGS